MRLLKAICICFFMSLMFVAASFADKDVPFEIGETIEYDIVKMHMPVGQAKLVYHGSVDVDGIKAHLMVFTASALNFFDEELIYFDPKTYYPLIVKRNLNLWGRKEVIVETYDVNQGQVTIVKQVKGKEESRVIKSLEPLDNIYCFIYRYRHLGDFSIGDAMTLNLPTQTVKLNLVDQRVFKINKEERQSFYMQSDPKEFRLWFDAGQVRIPLRIDGALGFGKTALVLRAYHPQGVPEIQP